MAVKVARCQLLLSKLIKWHGWDHGVFHMRDTATDVNIESAVDKVYAAVDTITYDNAYFRRDIAHRALGRTN